MSENTIKVLSQLVTQRPTVEESGSIRDRQPSGLLELPNELLLPILNGIGDMDLLSLVFLCRRLHLLALPMYLARIHVLEDRSSLSTDKIVLSAERFAPIVSLLLRSLCIASVKYLECQLPGPIAPVLTHVRKVRRFVSKLSSVDQVLLEFHRQYTRKPESKLVDWGAAFGQLLKTLSDKSCKTFTIKHAEKAADAFIPIGANPFTKAKPNVLLRVLSYKNLGHSFRPKGDAALINNPNKFAKAILPIYALNGSQITTLSLDFIQTGPDIWAEILSSGVFPELTNLRISSTSIAIRDLTKFLARHPLITTLNLSWVTSPRKPPPHGPPTSILPNVKTIYADRQIVAFLMMAKLPSLRAITMPLTFVFTKRESQMTSVNEVLSVFENRKNNIALTILMSMEFDAGDQELSSAAADIDTDPSAVGGNWQRLVKDIVLNPCVQHPALSGGAIQFVPPWFGRNFSALEHVSIGYGCASALCPYHRISPGARQTLSQMLHSACPLMKTITINGLTI